MSCPPLHPNLASKPLLIFRVDASSEIGTGHVMRCLTLAHQLKAHYSILFICAELPGHSAERIRAQGFEVALLPRSKQHEPCAKLPPHAAWLQASALDDARQTLAAWQAYQAPNPAWLVVDHYALDQTWQGFMRQNLQPKAIMVIDDLADRVHDCDLLLDQTPGRKAEDYQDLISGSARSLLGQNYALLRAEFQHWREESLARRDAISQAQNLLISLGGIDEANVTAQVLRQLAVLPTEGWTIQVIMGSQAVHLNEVAEGCAALRHQGVDIALKVNPPSMAECMAAADYAVCAAGSTTWERFCLGLPALTLVVADNQRQVGQRLAAFCDVLTPDELDDRFPRLWQELSLAKLQAESRVIRQIIEGRGAERVVAAMLNQGLNPCLS